MSSWFSETLLGKRMEVSGGNYWVDDPVYGLSALNGRPLDSLDSEAPIVTSQQLYILRTIALVGASISLTSGIVVGWWFVRMKRSFRHHLIMLLIFSDFFKASWQLIYPAVVFTKGAVLSNSRFCQAAGFFMSMGIEASDFAVLVIAVHSALYIFRPGLTALGEGGLFRYRHTVYIAWLAFSILMPSLAYVNTGPAYTAQGTFCYLPVRPFWYRMSLAWIPRYVILLTILIIYASIYTYVRMKFRTFRSHVGASTLEMDTTDLAAANQQPRPDNGQLPQLDVHGLIPASPVGDSRQASNASDQPFAKALIIPQTIAEKLNFSPCNSEARGSTCDEASSPSRRDSLPISISNAEGSNNMRGANQDASSAKLRGRRIAISRQLRLLFIYPLVYALMWVAPLISHLLEYQDRFVKNPSFPLACMVAFTIPVQCAVDCWLFTIREKPWRYIPKSDGKSFWSRYGFIAGEEGGNRREEGDFWRKKKNMTFEARKAYERREEERKEAAEVWLTRQEEKGRRPPIARRTDTNWWEIVDNVETMEEVTEEEAEPSSHDELAAAEEGRSPTGEDPRSAH